MEEDKVTQIIKQINMSTTEDKILDRLVDRLRWPKTYPWQQPSVEAINQDGSQHQNFFDEDDFLLTNKKSF